MSGAVAEAPVDEKRQGKRGRRPNPLPYDSAGPERLAKTPARAPTKRGTDPLWKALKGSCESRLNQLRMWRQSWLSHWSLLETYLLPRRGIFINNAMRRRTR